MPDTEATAPVVETPAAAPVAPTGKSTDAQRIAAAAEMMGKLEAKPFDPSLDAKKADAEKPAETEPEPSAKTEDAPREVTVAEWRQYKAQKKKLERREESIGAKEAEFASIQTKLTQFEAEKKLLRENPKAFWAKVASESGSDFTAEYSKMADAYLSEGAPDAKLDQALKKISELETRIAGEKEAEKAENDKRAAASHQNKVVADFLRVALVDEHKSTAYTIRKYGTTTVIDDAFSVGKVLHRELGRNPTDGEIAKRLEQEYEKHYNDIVNSRSAAETPQPGDTERVNGAGQPAKPVAPKAPKTLTNGGSAERATPARKLTERERIEAATKLLPG